MPSAVFRRFGTTLVGIPYIQGASATVFSTWTAADTAGHTLPAGTYVTVGNLGFYVQADATINATESTVTDVLLIAADVGTAYNGATGPVELVDAIDWFQDVELVGQTSGGADPETDEQYQDRLAGLLALQAPRPITALDYQTFVLSFTPDASTDQQEIGRAVAIDGYDPTAATSVTGDVSTGSATLANVTPPDNIGPGTLLSGGGIPANTTVLQNQSGQILMSNEATSSATAEAITATGLYNQERSVGVFVAAADGTELNTDTLAAAEAWLETFREVNFIISVLSPNYTLVYVNFQVKCYPTADPDGTVAAVKDALMQYLSPSGFGLTGTTGTTTSGWVNDPVVRYTKLIGIIENTPGVDYVTSLSVGADVDPIGTIDVPIWGPAGLVESTVDSISGSAA